MLRIFILFIFNMKYVRMLLGPVWKYISPIYNYAFEVFAALSQLTNAVLFGDNDQTFAARCHEGAILRITWLVWMERLLNVIWSGVELGHCKSAFDSDTERSYDTSGKLKRLKAFRNGMSIRG